MKCFHIEGINEDNLGLVRWCLQTSELDKSLRNATGSLYKELRPQDVTQFKKEDYIARVKDVIPEKQERRFLISTGGWI